MVSEVLGPVLACTVYARCDKMGVLLARGKGKADIEMYCCLCLLPGRRCLAFYPVIAPIVALTICDRLYCVLSSEAISLEQSQKLTSLCFVGISGACELSWMVQKLDHIYVHSRFV